MSLWDKWKRFYNSKAGNILALIIGIIALIITFVMLSDRAEASELVEGAFDFPSIKDSAAAGYITDLSAVMVDEQVNSNNEYTYLLYIFTFEGSVPRMYCKNVDGVLKIYFDENTVSWRVYESLNGSEWSFAQSGTPGVGGSKSSYSLKSNTLTCSTVNLYSSSSYDTLFFQQTPLSQILSDIPTVVGVMTAQQMSQTSMMELIGLVPLLAGLVISAVALRKGWKFLRARLKKA